MTYDHLKFAPDRPGDWFTRMLSKCLPPGQLFETMRSSWSVFYGLLSAFGKELRRVEENAYKALNESTPGLAVDVLADWEEELSMPPPCIEGLLTNDKRQIFCQEAHAFVCEYPTAKWFESYFARHNISVTINEDPVAPLPFRTGGSGAPAVTRVGSRLNSVAGVHKFSVSYSALLDADLKRFVKWQTLRLKPAHTSAEFIEV